MTSGDDSLTGNMPALKPRLGFVTSLSDLLVLLLLTAGFVLLHTMMPGPIPSGSDGGNWLAVARGYLGESVMSADVGYPPAFPLLLSLLLLVAPPITALVISALIGKSLLVIAVFVCCRPLGRPYALAAAACAGVAGAQLEAFAWGGYPQLMGTAFGLLSVFNAIRWLEQRERRSLAFALGLGILTFATHELVSGLILLAVPVAILHWLLSSMASRADWLRAIILACAFLVPGGIQVVLSMVANADSGVVAVLNPYGVSRLESIGQITRDAALPWILVGALGIAAFALRESGHRVASLTVGSSWSVAGLAFFLVTAESRGLLLTQVGAIILASVVVRRMFERIGRRQTDQPGSRIAFRFGVILVISMLSGISAGGLVAYSAAISWYGVANQEVLRSLDWLYANSKPDDVVIASAGPNGNPTGWWIEGYGERRTYTGVDVRSLSFPEERAQAETANLIFTGEASGAETRSLLEAHGLDYLVVDRRGPNSGWLSGNVASGFQRVYDSPTIVVLEVDSN